MSEAENVEGDGGAMGDTRERVMEMGNEKEMDIRVEILKKHNDFAEYVNGIDYASLRKSFTRKEIEALEKMLREIDMKSVTLELSKITEEMKLEEYPQLNSVHHFPIINEMDFLTLSQKETLDAHLSRLTKGSLIYNLYVLTSDKEKLKEVESFLVEKELAEKVYLATCPYCHQGNVSNFLNQEEKMSFDAELEQYLKTGYAGADALERLHDAYCNNCDETVEENDLENVQFKSELRLITERDTSLENV